MALLDRYDDAVADWIRKSVGPDVGILTGAPKFQWGFGDWTVISQTLGILDQFWTIGVKRLEGEVEIGAWCRIPPVAPSADVDLSSVLSQLIQAAKPLAPWAEPEETHVAWRIP